MKRGKLYFIVGTDTDVGKTFMGLNIVKERLEKGIDVMALKPVETGFELFKNYAGADSYKYAELLNLPIKRVNQYFFKKPLSPHIASELDGEKIDIEIIKDRIDEELKNCDELYVEGAGGLFVPFTREYLFFDLIKEYKEEARVILVSKNSLGTVNHTLMSVEHLKMAGIRVEKIIFNNIDNIKDEDFLRENVEIVKEFCGVENVSRVGYVRI